MYRCLKYLNGYERSRCMYYFTPLWNDLNICIKFNRQKQEIDPIKFWKSDSSYVFVWKHHWRKKYSFITSNKRENQQNASFYRLKMAYKATE